MNTTSLLRRLASLSSLVAFGLLGCTVSAIDDEPGEDLDSDGAAYGTMSLVGIHNFPGDPAAGLPDWLGGGQKRVWVLELVAHHPDSYGWFHWNGQCVPGSTCDRLKKIAATNSELIARLDYDSSKHLSVPANGDWNGLWEWRQRVSSSLFSTTDGTPISRFAKTFVVGNEINLCGEAGMDASCGAIWPTAYGRQAIDPAWYADVYRGMRDQIRADAAASGYGGVNVMLQAASPAGYGETRYMHYVLGHLCNDTVDAIALHAYGWLDTPGADGTYGMSSAVSAQLQGIDEACGGKFRNVPVVITEMSRGDRSIANFDASFFSNAYTWMNTWNGDSAHHPIAGATIFHGGFGGAFPHEDMTRADRASSRDAVKAVVNGGMSARFGGAPETAPSTANSCGTGGSKVTFNEVPYTLTGTIASYWKANNGLANFGLPISNARIETNQSGYTSCTQWFERQRLELIGNTVYLGLVGRDRADEDYKQVVAGGDSKWIGLDDPHKAGCKYFPETRHTLCGGFKSYWESHGLGQGGSLALFGFPITEEFTYTDAFGTRTVQYFERARLEWHPQNAPEWQILGGLLAKETFTGSRGQ